MTKTCIPFKVKMICFSIAILLMAPPAFVGAEQDKPASGPEERSVMQLAEQHDKILGELRMIKREIALLRQEAAKPGIKDMVAGIGFIFGLFGSAAFVMSRRNQAAGKE